VRYREFCMLHRGGYSGSCHLHYAELLGTEGSFHSALEHIEAAKAILERDAPWAVGDAHRVIGDLLFELGRDDDALAAYDRAIALGWDPNPGYALLLMRQGKGDAACETLERSLIGRTWWTLQRRSILEAHLAIACAAVGRIGLAQEIIDRFHSDRNRPPSPSVRALLSEASGRISLASGAAADATRHFHLARQIWTGIAARQQDAKVRILIAEALLLQGNESGAETEMRAASRLVEALGSEQLRRRCAEVWERVGHYQAMVILDLSRE
jgi:tetratricopeptide (TPR) repeat protein